MAGMVRRRWRDRPALPGVLAADERTAAATVTVRGAACPVVRPNPSVQSESRGTRMIDRASRLRVGRRLQVFGAVLAAVAFAGCVAAPGASVGPTTSPTPP